MTFGDRLTSLLTEAGLTRAELAARLGVTRARVGELTQAEESPKLALLIRLAQALGCQPSELEPRLLTVTLPEPGSRQHKALKILEDQFGFRVEFVPTSSRPYMLCWREGECDPAAIVSGPLTDPEATNQGNRWGCFAPTNLQSKLFKALNDHA